MPRPQKTFEPDAGPAFPASSEPVLMALARGNAVLVEHVLELQTRAARLAGAEIAGRQRELMAATNLLARAFGWSYVDPLYASEMQEINRSWSKLALITQAALIKAVFGSFAVPGTDLARRGWSPERVGPERRVSAKVIRFPDRRKSGN